MAHKKAVGRTMLKFIKNPVKQSKSAINGCRENKVGCAAKTLAYATGAYGLQGTVTRNVVGDIAKQFKDTKAAKFIASAAKGAKKTAIAAGSGIINPLNTVRAAAKEVKHLLSKPRATFKGALKGVKNACRGKDRASCFGEISGSGFGIGIGLQSLQKNAQEIALKRGDKDSKAQQFGKGNNCLN